METQETAPAVRNAAPPAIFQLKSLEDLMKLSELLGKSNLIPTAYRGKPNDIAVCIMHGQEVGLSPIAALQSIAVINGNPGMYGDAPLALVRSKGLLEWIKEDWNEQTKTATCEIKRFGDPTIYKGRFSMADAQRAGFESKDNYKKFPARMCQFRARSFPLRDAFGDVLKGMRQAEEFDDIETTAEHVSSEPIVQMPQRASANGNGKNPAAQPKGDPGVEGARQPLAGKDLTDQRTEVSEHPENESQDQPAPKDDGGKDMDLDTLKAFIEKWIDELSDDELAKSSIGDMLFEKLRPFPNDSPEVSTLANKLMKRKKDVWKKRREAQAQQ